MSATAAARRKRKRRKPKPGCAPVKAKKRKKKVAAKPSAHAAAKRTRRRTRKVCKKKRKKVTPQPSGTHPAPALPAAPSPAPGPAPAPAGPPAPSGPAASPIAVYSGTFGPREAERLLWRAGFGPRPGDVGRLVALGLDEAVFSLTRPSGAAPMSGAEPTVDGSPLSPLDTWYGDHLYWFDRMVRSGHQLVERLALVFHDWWATTNDAVGSNEMMLAQTNVFRAHGLGSFREMTRAMTVDRAMLVFLNGIDNRRRAVNENYARELMELFTLGADRGAYTETDVRELARALTGWRADWDDTEGLHDFRFDTTRWDSGSKTVFGRTGAFNWEDACSLVIEHPLHASFFVAKLWGYFIPTPPPAGVAAALEQAYVGSGHQIRPVLEAILRSPQLYEGPRMVKPPVVQLAGMLRALGATITGEEWVWLAEGAGQRLYHPPDVAGWDDKRWLDSNTMRARWDLVNSVVNGRTIGPGSPAGTSYPAETADQALAAARAFWLDPHLEGDTVAWLRAYAEQFQPPADTSTTSNSTRQQRARLRAQRQNALRHLIAVSADYQTS